MSIIPRNIHHKCYDHYKERNYEALFTCDGCKMKGYGKRYECKLCGTKLHAKCRFPRSTITHEHFPGSTFTFLNEPFTRFCEIHKRKEFSKSCSACGKDICGFSYHCKEDNKDLHPCCRILENKLLIGTAVVVNLKSKVSSKCGLCKMRESSSDGKVRGWSYVSTCGKYHFHVYCMMEIVYEAVMKNNGSEMGLKKVDLGKLAKGSGNQDMIFTIVKCLLKSILSAVLGDPSGAVGNFLVEAVSPLFK